ncbi:MAG: hypothetical protein ACYC63_18405 [Armatimonadota bacterium]
MNTKSHWLLPALLALAAMAPAFADLSISGVEVNPRLDLRLWGGSGVTDQFEVMATEINMRFSVNKDEEELFSVALAPNLYTDMEGRGRQMHFSNYYGIWNFGLDKPKLQFGQFVIPFGTLAEYDTHPLVLQTPYARTLGVRIDQGLALVGYRGETDYWLSLTSGDGRGRTNGSYAANLRLARDYERGDDAYRVGLSLLHGKQMPVFAPDTMPVPHDMGMGTEMDEDMMLSRADKTRVALDLDWLRGVDNVRAEFVAGWDDGDFVHGQWLSYNHPFSYDTDLTVQAEHWRQRDGKVYGLGLSLHHRLDELSGIRAAFEPRWARSDVGPDDSIGLFTIQYYKNWLITF